jgi:hypothetical protein
MYWHKSLDHSEKNTNSKYAAKMRELRKAGIRPILAVFETTNDKRREDFHIESLVNAGHPLTNRMQNPAYSGQGVGQRGVDNNKAKLTEPQVLDIRERSAAGESRESLAKAFGCDPTNIRAIVNRSSWRHLPA